MQEIIELASKLPSGLPDGKALKKLKAEMDEFHEAVENEGYLDAAAELADVVYYCAKLIHHCASFLDLSVNDAITVCKAKYALRAIPGNPKNHVAEAIAIFNCLTEIWAREVKLTEEGEE